MIDFQAIIWMDYLLKVQQEQVRVVIDTRRFATWKELFPK